LSRLSSSKLVPTSFIPKMSPFGKAPAGKAA
jgi:hypothetical protein